jgi:CheY-like chemotaxis protein
MLELVYGSRDAALGALDRSLAVAGRSALPDPAHGLLAFVRDQLTSVLSGEIGPELATALVDDYTGRLEAAGHTEATPALGTTSSAPPTPPRSNPVARVALRSRSTPPPAPTRRVLIVDSDRVGRATLARALVRSRWGVQVVDTSGELSEALADKTPPSALILDVKHENAVEFVNALVAAAPNALVLLRGPLGAKTHALAAVVGAGRVEVRAHAASAEDIIAAVERAGDI